MRRWINHRPSLVSRWAMGLIPLLIVLLLYAWGSHTRLAENPNDRLMPNLTSMVTAMDRLAFQEDRRTGQYLFWQDTRASLQRIGLGVGISAVIGLVVGLVSGALPLVRASASPLVTILSLIPPMAILPILFIIFGIGEFSKVMLIVIGTAPFIVRDLQQHTQTIPSEQLIKAQTLSASSWLVIWRVLLPQVLPRLLMAMRLSLGTAWLFLIAAEAIASTEGLGYRIFLVRRFMSMEIILPYVIWITTLAFLLDWSLSRLSQWLFPWYHRGAQ